MNLIKLFKVNIFKTQNHFLFQKSDLLSNNRKLLHEGAIKWMSARGKTQGKYFRVEIHIVDDLRIEQ